MFTEISVNDINDFRLGHASNKEAGTGVTVIYFPDGATAGCDISGGGPASRETPLTMPIRLMPLYCQAVQHTVLPHLTEL